MRRVTAGRTTARRATAGRALVAAALALGLSACTVTVGGGGTEASPADPAPTAAAPPPSAPASPAPETGGTSFGASFQRLGGESYPDALVRTEERLDLEVVRVFYPGLPDPWPGKAPDRDLVVSFKIDPAEVLAGDHDDTMRQWFQDAPTDRSIHWVYWHEPESGTEDALFTPDEFREAFAHLSALADETGRDDLQATVVLMSWSLNPQSRRDWEDWFPPADSVDVLAWDVYNRGRGEPFYADPADLLGPLQDASASVGKPWAVGEMGSPLAPGDDGEDRAAWITSVGCYLVANDARFAAYFDFLWANSGNDYRLDDEPSATAWRELGSLGEDDPGCP